VQHLDSPELGELKGLILFMVSHRARDMKENFRSNGDGGNNDDEGGRRS
jgi:hypothetical protein